MIRSALLMILALGSTQAVAQISASSASSSSMVKPYASVEVRHHIATYYDEQGYYNHQEPSLHARFQFGTQLYDGALDLYGTLGVYKRPETQQIMQRKPELALDAYPFKTDYLTVLVYNILQFPVKNPDYLVEDEREDTGDGTVYIFGLSPTVKFKSVLSSPRIDLKFGADGWTKLYSRKQYTADVHDEDSFEGHGTALTGTSDEEIEDTAMHYKVQAFAGGSFNHSGFRELNVELTTYYESDFSPVYERSEEAVSYHYGVDRFSFYKIRLNWEISSRLSFANDFYQYYDGLYKEKRTGEEHRYRNVARLTCKL